MKNSTLHKMLVRGLVASVLIGFSIGLNTLSGHAADELSPVLAVHKSKLLSSNFLPKDNHSVQSGDSVFMKSSFERRFESSKLQSSRLVKSSNPSSNPTGPYSRKTHTAKPHRKL
ncbi:MAG: hypothetical protein P9L94_11665 [Candidatus Hinthialibacter antarcticus]|nr:hypothetical protein [Candidatus Hinthialibacter antarcticus]